MRARVFGGRTTHWNAVALRFSRDDFREWSTAGIEERLAHLLDEMQLYHEEAGSFMVVCGSKENLEVLPDGQLHPPFEALPEQILKRARKVRPQPSFLCARLRERTGHGRANCHFCGHCMMGCAYPPSTTPPSASPKASTAATSTPASAAPRAPHRRRRPHPLGAHRRDLWQKGRRDPSIGLCALLRQHRDAAPAAAIEIPPLPNGLANN
ncbi:MAG: hypothetical protein H6509_15830 [Bryobacterales bacterium]|nr:hypothetical protein [Bryobacterales bacterium]